MLTPRTTYAQAWRFAAVGLAANAALYAGYLLLTHFGAEPKLAMTVLYALGVLQTFFFNKRWSFRSSGPARTQFWRYCVTYAVGYLFNLATLFLLVDRLGWRHEWAQGILILVTAALLFLLQKFWVFRAPAHPR